MKMKYIIIYLASVLAVMLVSCSDWTETESLKIKSPSIDQINPELYKQYLEDLRNYKKSAHPIMIGWFDNSNKNYASIGTHIAQVPDKVDILSLLYPDNLTDTEKAEMATLREKGTSVIYTIDCQKFEDAIIEKNNQIESKNVDLIASGHSPLPLIVFSDTLSVFIDNQLALLKKYNYDGFSLIYNGQSTWSLTDEAVSQMKQIQSIIFNKSMSVIEANKDKMFLYEGLPQYLIIDRSILSKFNYLVFQTYTATNLYNVTRYVQDGLAFSDIPNDRVIVQAAPEFTSESGTVYGKISDTKGTTVNAIKAIAGWVKTTDPKFQKAGMGVWMMNKDYYIPGASYNAVQQAIDIMNPSAK